jgi:hypothetical protein
MNVNPGEFDDLLMQNHRSPFSPRWFQCGLIIIYSLESRRMSVKIASFATLVVLKAKVRPIRNVAASPRRRLSAAPLLGLAGGNHSPL